MGSSRSRNEADGGSWAFQAEMLLEVAALLNSTLERDQVLGTLAQQFLRMVAADWVVVVELAESTDEEFSLVAGAYKGGRALELGQSARLALTANPFLTRALVTRSPVWVQDVAEAQSSVGLLGVLGAESVLSVPLIFRDAALGVLAAGWEKPVGGPSSREMRLIQGLANQAATAMENARLYAAAERRAQQVTALFEIGRDISANLALSEILTSIVGKAQELLESDTSFLALLSPDGQELEMVASVGLRSEAMRTLRLKREQGLAGVVVSRGEPIIVDDYPREVIFKDPPMDAVHEEGLRSEIGVPLINGKQLLGVLYIGNREAKRFNPEHAQLLMAFAKQATIAIQNARLYEVVVAQRERAEAGRRDLQVVIDSMPEGVVIAEGADGRISTINRAGKLLMGIADVVQLPREAAILSPERGSGLPSFFTPNGSSYPWEDMPLSRSIRSGEVILGVEVVIKRPDGTHVSVLSNSAPFRDLDDKVAGAVFVFQDISKSKEAEQLKDEFISLVSHELRTPLTSIKGAARTILRHYNTLDPETRGELIRDIDEESDRLYRLVENLLDFSRAEAGVLRLATEPVHLPKLLERVVGEASSRSTGYHFVLHLPADLPPAEADPMRVEQVLRNLLDNAIKYSPNGGEIRVDAAVENGMLRVSIKDQGVGVPQEDRERVFGRFERGGGSDSSRPHGVGLGLAICRRLVEAHGGTIWVDSGYGGGSTFSFTLPLVEEAWG
ncbi:MAG TPA: GAF domain-containing protein [Chloroflexota bacterium]|nr:GAF domain-containing protein [Chloroflexota bacterium]